MNASTFALHAVLLLGLSLGAERAAAAEVVLQTSTGATVACAELAKLHDVDMQRRFGIDNFAKAHEAYVRLRTYGPNDCRRGEVLAAEGGRPAGVSTTQSAEVVAVRGDDRR